MRLAILAYLAVSCASAMGQCPIQLRTALTDATGKHMIVRYYNPGPRLVRSLHFVVKNSEGENQSTKANFAAKVMLPPKKEGQQIFAYFTNVPGNSELEIQVLHVSFSDRSTWTAPHENPCRVPLTQQ